MVHMNNLEGFIYNLFVRSDLLDVLQPFSYWVPQEYSDLQKMIWLSILSLSQGHWYIASSILDAKGGKLISECLRALEFNLL